MIELVSEFDIKHPHNLFTKLEYNGLELETSTGHIKISHNGTMNTLLFVNVIIHTQTVCC